MRKRQLMKMIALFLTITMLSTNTSIVMAGAENPENAKNEISEEIPEKPDAARNEAVEDYEIIETDIPEIVARSDELEQAEESEARAGANAVPQMDISQLSYQNVHDAMIALKTKYPEGMAWTNYVPYGRDGELGDAYWWKGGKIHGGSGGVGCAAFAFILSDTAFGDLPARDVGKIPYEEVRVGDILRVRNNTHFVIVLEKNPVGVTVAEANYNKSVHWGRVMSAAEVEAADFVITRYPENYTEPDDPEADVVCEQGAAGALNWTLTNAGKLTISGNGVIPDYGLGEDAAPWLASENSSKITMIVIESGVTEIGNYAFYKCAALSVFIPDGVTRIGNSAFREANILSITTPISTKTIGDDAFQLCPNLASVSFSEGLEVIGERAFQGCVTLGYVDFPSSVTTVGAGAFTSGKMIAQVRFLPSDHFVTFGDNVFTQCWYLVNVILPPKVKTIGAGMFQSCVMLDTLYIPETVDDIASDAFTQSALYGNGIYYGGTEEQWQNAGGKAAENVFLPNGGVKVTYNVSYKDAFGVDPNETDIVPAEHSHVWSSDWANDALHHWHVCTAEDCDITDYADVSVITDSQYAEHTYCDLVIDKVPTATEAGSGHYDCAVCGYRKTQTLDPTGSGESPSPVPDPSPDPSPTTEPSPSPSPDPGPTTEPNPTVTVKPDPSPTTLPTVDPKPSPSPATPSIAPTITPVPTITMTPIPPRHSHVWSSRWTNDALHHWHACVAEDCDITDYADASISTNSQYAEHTYGDWVIDKAPTATEAGSRHCDCSVCGYRKTEAMDPTGSSEEPSPVPEPSPDPSPTTDPKPTVPVDPKPSPTAKPKPTARPTTIPRPSTNSIAMKKAQQQMQKYVTAQVKAKVKVNPTLRNQLKIKLRKQLKLRPNMSKRQLSKLKIKLKKQLKAQIRPRLKAKVKKQLQASAKKRYGKKLGKSFSRTFNKQFETQFNRAFNKKFDAQYNLWFKKLTK